MASIPTTPPPPDTSTTVAPTTTTTLPIVRCSDLADTGASYAEALGFWLDHGTPARMDADGNGVPCESVYADTEVAAILSSLTPIMTGDSYADALSRDLVPWSQLGPGWYLATFIGSVVVGETAEDIVIRPTVLYLVHQDGRIYELDSWSGSTTHRQLFDWSPDGRHVLAITHATQTGEWDDLSITAELIDLRTKAITVLSNDLEELNAAFRSYSFTRPTGRNLVELHSDWEEGSSQIRRLRRDGSEIATVATQEGEVGMRQLGYLYLLDGTGLVLAEIDGLSLVRNSGTKLRDLWMPQEMWCTPHAWYDQTTFSADCYSDDPDVLPHDYFAESWLIPINGTAGNPVTDKLTESDVDDGAAHVGHEGYHGAWPTPAGTVVQGTGDCSTAWIVTLDDDRESVGSIPGNMLVGIHDDVAVVKTWEDCSGIPGSLIATTVDGAYLYDLVTVEGDVGGIHWVLSLAEPQQ